MIHQTTIHVPAHIVWETVSDVTSIVGWFPGVASCSDEGERRVVTTTTGVVVTERIVANDAERMRFQYSLEPGPVPVESHLATIDVVDHGPDSLVIYTIMVAPDAFAERLSVTAQAALLALKDHLEREHLQ